MLPQEQIRLPFPVHRADQVLDERHMVRAERPGAKFHVRLLGGPVPLAVVATYAGAHKVLPRITTTARLRNDVIYRKRRSCLATVDTTMVVTPQDILPGQLHLLVRNMNVERKAYNAWIRIRMAYGAYRPVRTGRNQFGLAEPQKDDRLLDAADA